MNNNAQLRAATHRQRRSVEIIKNSDDMVTLR